MTRRVRSNQIDDAFDRALIDPPDKNGARIQDHAISNDVPDGLQFFRGAAKPVNALVPVVVIRPVQGYVNMAQTGVTPFPDIMLAGKAQTVGQKNDAVSRPFHPGDDLRQVEAHGRFGSGNADIRSLRKLRETGLQPGDTQIRDVPIWQITIGAPHIAAMRDIDHHGLEGVFTGR